MTKFSEWLKQYQQVFMLVMGIVLTIMINQYVGMIGTVRDNRRDIDKMQKDIELKASREVLAEHIAFSGEQRRQIEIDLDDHNERIKYLERKP